MDADLKMEERDEGNGRRCVEIDGEIRGSLLNLDLDMDMVTSTSTKLP